MGVQLRTRVALVLVVTTGVWTSAACGAIPSKTGAALPPVTLTALSYNAAGRPPGDQLEEFAKRVEAADVGITLRILPAPDSGMPDTSVAVIDQVRTDGVDLGVVSSRSFDTLGVNAFQVIQAPLLAIMSADDERNPFELGLLEREIQRVRGGRFIIIPASEETRGHNTVFFARFWKDELATFLRTLQ